MPNRVTGPNRVVTDPVLLSALTKHGIDKDFVEFVQDYAPRSLGKGHSPYAKFYRDLKSNKRFMVVSGLPMVDADGVKIECGWKVAGINYFAEKNNLFRAKVQGTQVEITIRNDQPDGRKAGDKLTFKPQLFLDEVEQKASNPVLLPVDPVNSNYSQNVLEWDYGICKRRLRIIEGRLLGSWVFPSNPEKTVRIKYNQVGDYRLRLGQFKVSDDEELIKPIDFEELAKLGGYPVTISDSATYYPDPHTENTSVDGYISRVVGTPGEAWATLRAGAGTSISDTATFLLIGISGFNLYANYWYQISRSIMVFDASPIIGATVSAVTESLYGSAVRDDRGWAPNINIYSSLPASNIALVQEDFTTLGTTAYSTTITYANWKIADPFLNDFAFNAAGIAAVQTALNGDGIVKTGIREVTHDVGGTTPSPNPTGDDICNLRCYSAEQGNGYKPKLVVTYTVPSVDYPISTSTNLSASATIDRDVAWDRVMSPALSISATIAKSWGRSITTNTALAISTTISIAKGWSISLITNLAASTTINRVLTYIRTSSPGLTVSATVVRTVAWGRATSTALSVAVSILKSYGRAIVTSTGLTVAVSVVRTLGKTITTSTSLAVSATIARALSFTRSTTTNLTASVTVARTFGRKITTSTALSVAVDILVSMPGRILKIIAFTSTYRKLNIFTSQYRLAKAMTALYRKVKSFTSGG